MSDPEAKPTEAAVDAGEEVGSEDHEDVEEVVELPEEGGEEGEVKSGVSVSQLMQDPQMLAALQERLGSMVGNPSGYIQSLPKSVKRRIKGLKKLQFEVTKIEANFYKEVHELECKYAVKYAPLMDRRREVVTGGIEPTDSDCEWPSDEEKDEDELAVSDELKKKAKVDEEKTENTDEEGKDVTGIPSFWLTVFKNVDMLSEMVQDHDEPILSKLQDIKVKFSESEPMGFTLEFNFESNEFFTNTVLTKHYVMKSEPDEADPFSFEGPEIVKCKGCSIDWKKGKNVTVKTIKKKQKHKGRGTTRTVTKTVQNDSFFNFFNPPTVPEDEEAEMDEDIEALLAADFEIGHFIRERIVPRAVLYFTGEALDNDEFEEEGDEEEADAEDGDEDENDPDFNPQAGDKPAPTECKQQ